MLQGSSRVDVVASKMFYHQKTQNFGKNKLLLHAKYSALNRMQLQVKKTLYIIRNPANYSIRQAFIFSGGFEYILVKKLELIHKYMKILK